MKVLSLLLLTMLHLSDGSLTIRGASLVSSDSQERALVDTDNTTVAWNPCFAVRCSSTNPICIVKEDGSPACVKDTCVDTVCTADSTCQVDSNGTAICVPVVISPLTTPITCANVKCAVETPLCVDNEIGGAVCVEDVCKDEPCADGDVCVGIQVQCIKAPCPPIPQCIKNPCVDLICNAASTCEIDLQGNAFCLPLPGNPGNPLVSCAAVTCVIETPVCIIKDDGTAACIADPCLDTVCTADSTCQVDSNGKAICVPIVISPVPVCKFACKQGYVCVDGECVPQITCANVRCASDTPICVNSQTGGATCVEDVCKDTKCADGEVCFGRQVQCIRAPCPPIPECIKDPCVDLICNAASTCEIDLQGNAFCLPLPGNPGNPIVSCAAVTCALETPVCIIKDDGTATCIADPCLDTVCTADSTCQVDSNGKAICVPIVISPAKVCKFACSSGKVCINGKCVKDPCVNKGCKGDSTCQIDGKGKASCVPAVKVCKFACKIGYVCKNGKCVPDNGEPLWWDYVKAHYSGKDLTQCKRRGSLLPVDGSKCTKKGKTCFFGNQDCAVVSPFPTAKCKCAGGKWKCDSGLKCPATVNDKII